MLTKITPTLFVDSIEEQLVFWVEIVGFEQTVSVPESEGASKLGFVILVSGLTEIMLQTWKSVEDDLGSQDRKAARSCLFIETDNLDAMEGRLAEVDKVVERRTTFYGAMEIVVQDPAGNLIVFAQFLPPGEKD